MLERFFETANLFSPPRSIETRFLRPNRLGDEMTLHLEQSDDRQQWQVSGRFAEAEHFRISGISASTKKQLQQPGDDFVAVAEFSIGGWACDSSGSLAVSTYYELLSDAVERWFETVPQVPFRELHFKRRLGIPTVSFATDVVRVPMESDEISMFVSVDRIGTKSLQLIHALCVGDECLIVTRQVIVFVAFEGTGYASVPIPSDIRNTLREQQAKSGG